MKDDSILANNDEEENALNTSNNEETEQENSISDKMDILIEGLADMVTSLNSVFNTFTKIVESIGTAFVKVATKVSEATKPLRYLQLLSRLKWPLFFLEDEILSDDILEACATEDDEEAVRKIVEAYFTEDVINRIESEWLACKALCEQRKHILSEALEMHRKGYYLSSVTILMCQLGGVGTDIVNLTTSKGLVLEDDGKEFMKEYFNIDEKHINKNQGPIYQAVMFTDGGVALWFEMIDYLKNVTFISGTDYEKLLNHPLRNKIAHGEQTNYGTKEHSIKSILVVDMLIQLLYHIDVLEVNDGNDELQEDD